MEKLIEFVLKCLFLFPVLSFIDSWCMVLVGKQALSGLGIVITGESFWKWFLIFYVLVFAEESGKIIYQFIKSNLFN